MKENKSVKIVRVSNLLLPASLFALVILLLNSYYVWSWGDDYLIKNILKSHSVSEFLFRDYLIFDGRSLNLGYFISRGCLATDITWLASMIASFLFLFSGLLLTLLSGIGFNQGIKKVFIYTMVYTSMLWLASFYFLNQTLYWQTGMLYVVEVFLILLAYYAYTIIPTSSLFRYLVYFLFFIASVASPGAVIGLFFVLMLEYIYAKYSNNRKSRKDAFWIFVSVISGLLVVLLAPGSMLRFTHEGGVDMEAFSYIHNLYFRIHQFVNAFLSYNTPVIWLVLFMGIAITPFHFETDKESNTLGNKILHQSYEYRWLLAALISLLFYLPRMMYYIGSSRLNIHFVFYSMVFLSVQIARMRQINNQPDVLSRYRLKGLFLPLFICFGFSQFWGSRHAFGKIQAREALYQKYSGKKLVLKANDIIGPPGTKLFIDVDEDTAGVINKDMAKYYGLKSLSREPYRSR